MRALAFAAILITSPPVFAQQAAQRPEAPPPSASASFEQREAWCEQFASWFVASTPQTAPAPADVRQTHEFEVEFNSCKIDPARYERDTRTEAQMQRDDSAPG
jgi:hypothetical protein